MNEERERWYKGEGYENMHLQGRRWAGRMTGFNHAKNTDYQGSIYDAAPTFESYGVPHGSAGIIWFECLWDYLILIWVVVYLFIYFCFDSYLWIICLICDFA